MKERHLDQLCSPTYRNFVRPNLFALCPSHCSCARCQASDASRGAQGVRARRLPVLGWGPPREPRTDMYTNRKSLSEATYYLGQVCKRPDGELSQEGHRTVPIRPPTRNFTTGENTASRKHALDNMPTQKGISKGRANWSLLGVRKMAKRPTGVAA
jgi:hypothetical protein